VDTHDRLSSQRKECPIEKKKRRYFPDEFKRQAEATGVEWVCLNVMKSRIDSVRGRGVRTPTFGKAQV